MSNSEVIKPGVLVVASPSNYSTNVETRWKQFGLSESISGCDYSRSLLASQGLIVIMPR